MSLLPEKWSFEQTIAPGSKICKNVSCTVAMSKATLGTTTLSNVKLQSFKEQDAKENGYFATTTRQLFINIREHLEQHYLFKETNSLWIYNIFDVKYKGDNERQLQDLKHEIISVYMKTPFFNRECDTEEKKQDFLAIVEYDKNAGKDPKSHVRKGTTPELFINVSNYDKTPKVFLFQPGLLVWQNAKDFFVLT